jgi:hypothetical protein
MYNECGPVAFEVNMQIKVGHPSENNGHNNIV